MPVSIEIRGNPITVDQARRSIKWCGGKEYTKIYTLYFDYLWGEQYLKITITFD